jgi:hypothetical protein
VKRVLSLRWQVKHRDKVAAGLATSKRLMVVSEALWRRLWQEQESHALEHTDTLLAEGTAVLRRIDAASSTQQEVEGLKATLEGTVSELLAARELEIKMNAELQVSYGLLLPHLVGGSCSSCKVTRPHTRRCVCGTHTLDRAHTIPPSGDWRS